MAEKVIPVKVAVRCRPLIPKEESEGCQCCVQFVNDEPQLLVGADKSFTYDFVFRPDVDQNVVYEKSVQPLVQGFFKGYNATVLAYGQTGSGKTYSMGGAYEVSLETESMGIMPRVVREVFEGVKQLDAKYLFAIRVSYLELYKEDLQDLLSSRRQKDQVVIRDDPAGGIRLVGMTEVAVRDYEETMQRLQEGSQGRSTACTAMNSHSSRSHAIFTIHLERTSKIDARDFCKAKFHLVDLAGSERIKKTHAEGERMKEGININKGLLSLGNVISALGDDGVKKNHIPYRDSKLTRLLQDSLGGNSHTLMMACISPADSNLEETVSTLRYADRARRIKNKPVINQDPQAAEVTRLRQLVQDLQAKVLTQAGSVAGSETGSNKQQDCKLHEERIKQLEVEKRELIMELDSATQCNTHMMHRLMSAECAKERLDEQLLCVQKKLEEVKEGLEKNIQAEGEERETSTHSLTLALVQQAQDKICQITSESLTANDSDEKDKEEEEENKENKGDTSTKRELNEGGERKEGGEEEEEEEELRTKHVKRQAQLSRQLQDLNAVLMHKQQLASKMLCNEQQMLEMKQHYEVQSKEMEAEVDRLQQEKDLLLVQLQSAKASKANLKLAEERRKRVQELEASIADLKRKMLEQQRVIRMKEQSEKQVDKLHSEIQSMKQQRVRLLKQMKDDSSHFSKLKAEMAREVLQLKAQGRKRQAEMAKMENQNLKQQAVLKRKAQEAAAVNTRLKEVLLRQKRVIEDKNKKQDVADMTGAGARARKVVQDEMDLMLAIEEARLQLKAQLAARKEINHTCADLRARLDDLDASSDSVTDDRKQGMMEELREMNEQMDICNAQISELQQKLLDVDQEEKSKSRWNNIHTMMEAKCALKCLLNAAVAGKMEAGALENKMAEMKMQHEEVQKLFHKAEEESRHVSGRHDREIDAMRKEYEDKILYLLGQMAKVGVGGGEEVDALKRIVDLQASKLQQLAETMEQREKQTSDNKQKKSARFKSSMLPPLTDNLETKRPCKARRRSNFYEGLAEETSEEDDVLKDPSWRLTPQLPRQASVSLMPQLEYDDMNKTFVKADNNNGGGMKAASKKGSKKRASGRSEENSQESVSSEEAAKKGRFHPHQSTFFDSV